MFLFIIISFSFIFNRDAEAAIVFSISNPNINTDDEIEVAATISGLISSSCSISGCYIQAELQSAGGYFGYTLNNSGEYVDYFKTPASIDEIKTKLFNIIPSSGSWNGKLKAKNNPFSSNYYGKGDYLLTFRRFSGNSLSPTSGDSNSISVALNQSIQSVSTPTSSNPTDIPTATPIPTYFTLKTAQPSPKETPGVISVAKPDFTNTPVVSSRPVISTASAEPSNVLGTESGRIYIQSPSPIPSDLNTIPIASIILVFLGVVFIGIPIFSIIKNKRKEYTDGSEKQDFKIS